LCYNEDNKLKGEIVINKKYIAFTFDDAPAFDDMDENPTKKIVDTFEAFGGKATFFVVGEFLKEHGNKLIEKILEKGFEIENHSETHINLQGASKQKVIDEIMTLQNTVKKDFGVEMKYFRPAGIRTDENLFSVTKELGFPVISGSEGKAYNKDWDRSTPAEYIKNICIDNAYNGQIVLMHSYNPATAEVIGDILSDLSAKGYEFVTLTELFEKFGVDIKDIPCDRVIADAQLSVI